LHFSRLFQRYGDTIVILNIAKGEEKVPRETIIGQEFAEAINLLNSKLPEDHHIIYVPFDIRRSHKTYVVQLMSFLIANGFLRTDLKLG
jgi:hypothetical protein